MLLTQAVQTPQEPSVEGNLLQDIAQNAFLAQYNGVLASLGTPGVTTDTAADTLLAYTLPAGVLKPGQAIVVDVFGVNSADGNVKTLTLNFGATAIALVITGNAAKWWARFMIVSNSAAVQQAMGYGVQGATALTLVQPASTVNTNTGPTAITLTGTAATAGTITANAAIISILG